MDTTGSQTIWHRIPQMVLCYVDAILAISATPMKTIEAIKAVFKLKGENTEVPAMYPGALIYKMGTADKTYRCI